MTQRSSQRRRAVRPPAVVPEREAPTGLFKVPVGTKHFADETGEYRCDPVSGWAVEKLA